MSGPQPAAPYPARSAVFRWWGNRFTRLEKKILQYIIEDPEIRDATNLSVLVSKESGERIIRLIGKCPTEKGRERAEELARENSSRRYKVVNEIIVG